MKDSNFNYDFEDMTSLDIMALVIGLFSSMNLKVYDNGISIASNVLNNLSLE